MGLDEPMVGLDPSGTRLLKDLLRERCRLGRTVLMSTHTLSVAQETCDRVAILDHGRLRALGSVDSLRAQIENADASLEDVFLTLTQPDSSARDI